MMRAALLSKQGPIEGNLTVGECPKPDLKSAGKGRVLIRVHACSLSAAAAHMVRGKLSAVVKPRRLPFIPGQDVSGVVEQVMPGSKFAVGDRVMGTNGATPSGGMAEYCILQEKYSTKIPDNVPHVVACTLPDSAVTAFAAVEANIKPGHRVMVYGGSGGVGNLVIQAAKAKGAAFVATTSRDPGICERAGADLVVNYRETDWTTLPELRSHKFDVIIDCAGGKEAWRQALRGPVKSGFHGGAFIAVALENPDPVARNVFEVIGMIGPAMMRAVTTRLMPWRPRFSMHIINATPKFLPKVAGYAGSGKLVPVIATGAPFPMTEKGVRDALTLQLSGHAHGKVVVQLVEADTVASASATVKEQE